MGRSGLLAGKAISFERIEKCYAIGNMYSNDGYYCGLIGQTGDYWTTDRSEEVLNCYARVNIYNSSIEQGYYTYGGSLYTIANTDNYGFTTKRQYASVSNCYSAGTTYKGFINGTATDCYYNKELVSVQSGYATPATTNEMHAKVTYQNWDFENIWGRNDTINDGYPYLRVFHENAPEDSEDPIVVTGITLDVSDTLILAGTSLQVNATILPAEAEDKRISFVADTWGVSGALEYDFFESVDNKGLVKTHLDLRSSSR